MLLLYCNLQSKGLINMKRKKKYIDSKCIQALIKKERIPLLFVGSGLSKRYLKNYPSWDELISYVAETIGISESQLLAMQQEITDSNPSESKGVINAKIGSKLTKVFREKVISGKINLEDIFSDEEMHIIKKDNITFIKMLICKKLSSYEITDNPKYLSELTELKKLQSNIGAVVTTNYDKFLENEIFNNFDVFVEQSQYYMTECTGIGEIYKIHGSVSSPNSIIFNWEDYMNFEANLKVVAAKLLNLSLEYPIIFIGYSLEDENILKILNTLVDSLTTEQTNILSKNLIYIEWKKSEEYLRENEKSINKDGKSLKLTCITTDNYFVLYKHLQKFVPAEKPERVRKYKKMIHQLILNNNKGVTSIIANDNLDKLNSEGKLVIAFGEMNTFARFGVNGIKTEDLIKWVLDQKKDITNELANSIFVDYYLTTKVANGNYVPMFYISKFTDDHLDAPKLLNMKDRLNSWIGKINNNSNLPLYNNINELKEASSHLASYKYIFCIMKSYYNKKINYNECLLLLKELNSKEGFLKDSNFRKSISYIDLQE